MSLGLFLYRYRSYTPLPLLAVGTWLGHPTVTSIIAGFSLCASGELLRIWGVAAAGPLTRMTAGPGGDELATNGPYAFVRNPLYIGNILLYTGIGIMTNVWWLAVVAWMYFQFQYLYIIREEERYLQGKYGERYANYFANVRRFLPRIRPFVDNRGVSVTPDTSGALRSERRTFQAIVIALMIMCTLAYIRS